MRAKPRSTRANGECRVKTEPAADTSDDEARGKATENDQDDDTTSDTPALQDKALRMSYRIARGEQGVLTFEPYKSLLLPLWRFRTPAIARKSSSALKAKFDHYVEKGDFVGMDMARKFIQMGMTRAKRYANYKGGRKYDKSSGARNERSKVHDGHEDKLEASEIFKKIWEECRKDERYLEAKQRFLTEQKEWDKENPEGKATFEKMIKGGK